MGFAVKVNTLAVEQVGDNLLRLDTLTLQQASLRAVNEVGHRTFDRSIQRMSERVNLTPDYVRSNMGFEAANDPAKPTATVVAYRSGGRKRIKSGVNLRQYAPILSIEPNKYQNPAGGKRFTMKDGRLATTPIGPNPRAPGKRLPFVLRTGNAMLKIPVGSKAGALSVEVVKGGRKVIKANEAGFKPFMQRMPNGELLVMRRSDRNGGKAGKGKIESLYSLSTWQLFRRTAASLVTEVQDDLVETVGREIDAEIQKVLP